MKVTLKSLKQVAYETEIEDDSITILQLKMKVEELHGFDHQTMKLVFNGKITEDDKTLKDLQIVDNCVLIMMTAKAKPINSDPKPEQKAQNQEVTNPNSNTSTAVNPQPQIQKPATQEADYSKEIKVLTEEMGFPKEESTAAIKAARGNVAKAIDYLYNGIPDQVDLSPQQNSSPLDQEGRMSPIKSIASIIKVMCQNNPNNLQNILLGLQQTSPELIELIRENEDEFKNLVSQPISEEDMRLFQEFNRRIGPMQREGSQEFAGNQSTGTSQQGSRPGQTQIRITPEEMEAVNRLKAFGFSEIEALQAYMA